MSAYTRWLAGYEPVQARAAALLDECEALRQGPSSPEADTRLRAMLAEAQVYLEEADRWLEEAPEPSVGNRLIWAFDDFVNWSPYWPVVVMLAIAAPIVAGIAWAAA